MKYNKIFSVFAVFLLLGTNILLAQDNKNLNNQVKAKRIAFFTEKLQLTPAEAQKFWPVYNEYDAKKTVITAEKRKLTDFFQKNSASMTENDIDLTIAKFIQFTKQETALLEEYNKKFRQILPAQKVMNLYLAEVEFKIILLNMLKANTKGIRSN